MPFQVIYSKFSRPAGTINSFSAGPDQVVVCDTVVTLTASVSGDLFGHTILWEQISGAPVTFITPTDELSVTYVNGTGSPISGAVFDDKVFRFWIDKGSTNPNLPEMFDDVDIFGAPTDKAFLNISTTVPTQSGGYRSCNVPACDTLFISPTVDDGASCNTGLSLFWSDPDCFDIPVSFYQVEEYISGSGYSIVSTNLPTEKFYDGVISGRSYRVITHLANGATDTSCLVWVQPELPAAASTSYHRISTTVGTSISNLFRLERTVESKLVDGDINPSYHQILTAQSTQISNYSVLERILSSCDEPEQSDNPSYHQISTAQATQINNYFVIALDGSEIGG